MNHLIAILVQFLLGERFRKIVTNFLAKTLKKVLKGPRKRRKQKGRDRGRKENKKMATTTIHEIQKEFLNRIQDPENALLTVEGIMYDLSLDEGGLRDTADETSYCGITEESLAEFKQYDPTVTINSVREFTTLTTEAAANLITRFYMWYFQKPPKQNFFALPKLLWNIVCNASLLAPYPVIIRIQQLVGDPNPDGIWGSGTNKRIEQYFEGKTVDEIMQFALAFTQSIEARYRELGQNPEFADTADAWVERAYRKYNHIKTYVEDTQAAQAAAQQAVVGSPTPEQVVQPTPAAVVQPTPEQVVQPTPAAVVQPTPEQVVQPTPEVAAQPTPEVAAAVQPTTAAAVQPTPEQAVPPTPEQAVPLLPDGVQSTEKDIAEFEKLIAGMHTLAEALEEHNRLARELIQLHHDNFSAQQVAAGKQVATPPTPPETGGALGAAASAAKKALNVAEVATNPVGAAKKALENIIP